MNSCPYLYRCHRDIDILNMPFIYLQQISNLKEPVLVIINQSYKQTKSRLKRESLLTKASQNLEMKAISNLDAQKLISLLGINMNQRLVVSGMSSK